MFGLVEVEGYVGLLSEWVGLLGSLIFEQNGPFSMRGWVGGGGLILSQHFDLPYPEGGKFLETPSVGVYVY